MVTKFNISILEKTYFIFLQIPIGKMYHCYRRNKGILDRHYVTQSVVFQKDKTYKRVHFQMMHMMIASIMFPMVVECVSMLMSIFELTMKRVRRNLFLGHSRHTSNLHPSSMLQRPAFTV